MIYTITILDNKLLRIVYRFVLYRWLSYVMEYDLVLFKAYLEG